MDFQSIPIVDLAPFIERNQQLKPSAAKLREICKTSGFFYVSNHGVPIQLQESLKEQTALFFDLPKQAKNKIQMKNGGKAWRGYFELGEEYTSGKIDLKEGLYLGQELDQNNQQVKKGTPLHGRNLFPEELPKLKEVILEWLKHMERLGGIIMEAIAESLQIPSTYFKEDLCKEFLGLFRLFHYPKDDQKDESLWGVGEHTDYGLITILLVTSIGLQVKNRSNQWIKADPIPNTFIINIGDMLQRLTHGLYKSIPHRVRNLTGESRYSFPYFYDPGWNAEVKPIDLNIRQDETEILKETAMIQRWDKKNLKEVQGTYGKYLMGKISKVFPDLAKDNLKEAAI